MLDEEVAQFATTEAFEKMVEKMPISTEGIKQNTAPPAALLMPEAHDVEEVAALQLLKVQLKTRILDERPIASDKLETFKGFDVGS